MKAPTFVPRSHPESTSMSRVHEDADTDDDDGASAKDGAPPERPVTCRVPGHYLVDCGLCGCSMDERLVSTGKRQPVLVACDVDNRAQFYHAICWAHHIDAHPNEAGGVDVIRVAEGDDDALRHTCADDECPLGCLPTHATGEVEDADCAVIEIQRKAHRVAVYHASCALQTPTCRCDDGTLIDGAVAKAVTQCVARGDLGASRRTLVTLVGGGAVLTRGDPIAAGGSAPVPWCPLTRLVIHEVLPTAIPPRFKDVARIPAAHGVPWSFECFVRATPASRVHCTSWAVVSAPVDKARLAYAFELSNSDRIREVRPLPNGRALVRILHEHPKSVRVWLAYMSERITRRSTAWHPYAPCIPQGGGVTATSIVGPVTHGLDVFLDSGLHTTAYLASGVCPDGYDGDGPRSFSQWRALEIQM